MFDEYYLRACFDNAWIALKNSVDDGEAISPICSIIYSSVGLYPIKEKDEKDVLYYHKRAGSKWKISDIDLFKIICWIDLSSDKNEQDLFWKCFRDLNTYARDCLITRFDVQIGEENLKTLKAKGINCNDRKGAIQ